jgi:hypothetical protein
LAAFLTAFCVTNSGLLGGGLLVINVVGHVRTARRRRRIDVLVAAPR